MSDTVEVGGSKRFDLPNGHFLLDFGLSAFSVYRPPNVKMVEMTKLLKMMADAKFKPIVHVKYSIFIP